MVELNLGSRARKGYRPVGTVPYDSGNTSTLRLPKGTLWRQGTLRLEGNLGVSSTVTLNSETPLGLIQRIEIVRDGGDTMWSIAGRDAFRLGHFEHSKQPELVAPGTGVATHPFAAEIPINFEAIRRARPIDSVFDSAPYAEVELKITWAAPSALFSAGAATVSSCLATMLLEETLRGEEQIGLIKEVGYKERLITGDGEIEIELPRTSGVLDKLLIRTDRDGVVADNIITLVTLRMDNTYEPYKGVRWIDLQNKCVKDHAVDGGAASTGRISGYALLDPIEEGRIASGTALGRVIDPKLVLQCVAGSGTSRVVRVTHVIYKPRPDRAAVAA